MFRDSDSSADERKKVSKKNSKLDPTSMQETYFLTSTAEYKKAVFKLTKGFIDVCIMQLLLGQIVARVEW